MDPCYDALQPGSPAAQALEDGDSGQSTGQRILTTWDAGRGKWDREPGVAKRSHGPLVRSVTHCENKERSLYLCFLAGC